MSKFPRDLTIDRFHRYNYTYFNINSDINILMFNLFNTTLTLIFQLFNCLTVRISLS